MKLLHLVPKETLDVRMSRDRFLQVDAIARQCYVHTSGPGWPDWESVRATSPSQQSLTQEQQSVFELIRAHTPDLILVYDLLLVDKMIGNLSDALPPVVVVIKEGYVRRKVQRVIEGNDASLVIFQHLNVLNEWLDYASDSLMLAHIPHCAETALYPPLPLPTFHERPWDVTVIGSMNAFYYPHRNRLREIAIKILKKRGYRVRVLKHPGYKQPAPFGTYAGSDYARELSLSKVVLSCSGHQRAAFLKYVEAPMAGAVFGADIPDDRNFLRRTTLELPLHARDSVIVDRIETVLDDEDEWRAIAKPATELVRKYRTMDAFAEMFLRVCHEFFNRREGTKTIWTPDVES